MSKIKLIHILLIIIVLAIWVSAIRRMFVYSGDDSVMKKPVKKEEATIYTSKIPPERLLFRYNKPYRNLFLDMSSNISEKIEVKSSKPIKRKLRFNYSIDGVLYQSDNSVVIVKDNRNRSHFMKIGDIIGEFIVHQIFPDSVVFKTRDDQFITVSVKNR